LRKENDCFFTRALPFVTSKNLQCPKRGNKSALDETNAFPRKFGDFLKKKQKFLVKRSSLEIEDSTIPIKMLKSESHFLVRLHQGKRTSNENTDIPQIYTDHAAARIPHSAPLNHLITAKLIYCVLNPSQLITLHLAPTSALKHPPR